MTMSISRQRLLELEVFAQRCALHPELVRRFVALGLIEPAARTSGSLWFTAAQVHRMARMQRLRSDLALNYSALGLVMELLDRIEHLETAPRRRTEPPLEI